MDMLDYDIDTISCDGVSLLVDHSPIAMQTPVVEDGLKYWTEIPASLDGVLV